ncbi:MAG: hypothetical protein JSU68_01810 [Phycisphaerales bacterium]|nr:MAG: hypothetical protein JSU68_01810 [Phycisphaerales bacterium]
MNETTSGRLFIRAVCAAALVLTCGCRGEDGPEPTSAALVDTIDTRLPPEEEPPVFEFPEECRSKNESLNEFLDEFRGICERGEYGRYRPMVSVLTDPLEKERFENIWHAAEHVRIELIKRLPEKVDLPPPAYAVLARVKLREEYVKDEPVRLVSVVAFREEGEWVFAPSPDERINRAMRAAWRETQTEDEEPFAETQPTTSQAAGD